MNARVRCKTWDFREELAASTFAGLVNRPREVVISWCERRMLPSRMAATGRWRIRREVAEEYLSGRRPLPDGGRVDQVREAQAVRVGAFEATTLLVSGQVGREQRRALVEAISQAAEALAEKEG
jgi:hypothetical protein